MRIIRESNVKVLVQGTADWNQPIATNQHYMVRELATQYNVHFAESLGLRRPELSVRDIRRILTRLRWSRNGPSEGRPLPGGVEVISPKVVPVHEAPWVYLNRRILSHQFKPWIQHLGPKVFWTYSPVTYGFECLADASVYHCVDLYGQFPGIDSALIHRSELRLAETGAIAIGSSEVVVAHLERQGFKNVIYWPNVADTAEIRRVTGSTPGRLRSGALFAGNLSNKKVDFPLLMALVKSGVELHLAGPVAEGGGETDTALRRLVSAGATYHGVLTLQALSELMGRCKVGLIPYLINSYTLGVSPLKTYEYLAAGLAAVSTQLPGVVEDKRHIFVPGSSEEFVRRVQAELDHEATAESYEAKVALAELHSWTERGEQARSLVSRLEQLA